MKRYLLIVSHVLVFVGSWTLCSMINNTDLNKYHKQIINHMKSGNQIASYNGKKIIGDNYLIEIQEENNDLSKETLLRRTIDDYIILSEIDNSGLYKSIKYNKYLKNRLKTIIVDYYLNYIANIILNGKQSFLIDTNIDKIYIENIDLFKKNNISKDEAKNIIEMMVKKRSTRSFNNRNLIKSIEIMKLRKKYNIHIGNEL